MCAAILLASCGHVPPRDAVLTLRQRSLGTTVEMKIGEMQIAVAVKETATVTERAEIRISAKEAAEIRRLFWDALREPPVERATPVRDLVFEQEWRGPVRTYGVRIQGPLTPAEYRAYNCVNQRVPQRYRFLVDYGPQRRR